MGDQVKRDRPGDEPFGLLELGSNSLKFYLVGSLTGPAPSIETHKFPWGVAHEFFSHNALGPGAVDEVIETIRGIKEHARGLPPESMLAVATGVFRELPNMPDIARSVKKETGIRIRVISGIDEARLMARDFHLQSTGSGPTLLVDLGGATLEWAYMDGHIYRDWGSLPLGAIRNQHRFEGDQKDPALYLQKSSKYCDEALRSIPVHGALQVVATGGTAKAAARCQGYDVVSLNEMRRLMEQVLRMGPPGSLKPARQRVFLPGLVILWRVMVRCRAQSFTYGKASVRDGMAGRLTRLIGSYRREELHATLLLHSTQVWQKE